MTTTKKEESTKTNSENFKNAMCYVPFGAIVMFFAENKKTDTLKKNIKYGMILLGVYLIANLILGWLMSGILFVVYIGISAFLGYKAYNGEKVEIDYIDEMEKKVKEKL
ncbi:hypothetical protein LR004_00680 [Candidatus Gracilibacteria bacterium]|nr:hypothetical protein [Candidatus Gracilibacteria bacterium]